MPIYELSQDWIRPVEMTTFARELIRERADLQRILRDNISVVAPDVLVIAEEFSRWSDSNRRIDLLGVDRDGSLVIIELKRTEDGGHIELQALRYAAMVSPMTYEEAMDSFTEYLTNRGRIEDARQALNDHLGWDGTGDPPFNRRVRIVLVSLDFDKEITTTVLWLTDVYSLDIRCVRLSPYRLEGHLLINVQQIIPIPEATEYRVQLQKKAQQERVAREASKDQTRYDVVLDGTAQGPLSKRQVMFTVIKHLCDRGASP